QNRSRTRTQAINVPMKTLTKVTSAAWETVSRIAYAVCSLVTVAQKADHPPAEAVTTTAQRGMSTSRLNHVMAIPRPRPEDRVRVEGGRPPRRPARRPAGGRGAVRVRVA